MRTPQTAAEMIINNDLDSTLIPSFTRFFFFVFFFFLSMKALGTQKQLSLLTGCEGQHLIRVDNAGIVCREKVIPLPDCPLFSFLPIWIQTLLSPL